MQELNSDGRCKIQSRRETFEVVRNKEEEEMGGAS